MRSGEGVACSDTIGRCGVALGPVRDAGQAKLDFNTLRCPKKKKLLKVCCSMKLSSRAVN